MFLQRIARPRAKLIFQNQIILRNKHMPLCPTKICVSDSSPRTATSCSCSKSSKDTLRRAEHSGKCRLGFIPEEWFRFFYVKTGVTGPYIFGFMLINYLVSKEIYIMEHEYYLGLSIFLVVYVGVTKFGKIVGSALDKEVDEVADSWHNARKVERDHYENVISECNKAIWMAEGQNLLINAKKENVAMQLEAIYRERSMMVFQTVKNRLEYQVKKYYAEGRIHQKWMIIWILENVRNGITPEFKVKALAQAVADLNRIANTKGAKA